MAEEQQPGTGEVEPNGEPETDYQAKYEELLKHSREWERKAKANKAAADELDQLKASQMSEDEKRAQEIAALKAENERYKLTEQKRAWAEQVSKDTGVPAEVLGLFECSDADDLMAKAESVARNFRTETVPAIAGDGIHVEPKAKGGAKADFAACMEQLNR